MLLDYAQFNFKNVEKYILTIDINKYVKPSI